MDFVAPEKEKGDKDKRILLIVGLPGVGTAREQSGVKLNEKGLNEPEVIGSRCPTVKVSPPTTGT